MDFDSFVRRHQPEIATLGVLSALALVGILWAEDIRKLTAPRPVPAGPSASERGRALGREATAGASAEVLSRVPPTARGEVATLSGVVRQARTASHQRMAE